MWGVVWVNGSKGDSHSREHTQPHAHRGYTSNMSACQCLFFITGIRLISMTMLARWIVWVYVLWVNAWVVLDATLVLTSCPASNARPGETLEKEHRLTWWLSLFSSSSWLNWILWMSPSGGCLNIWLCSRSTREAGKILWFFFFSQGDLTTFHFHTRWSAWFHVAGRLHHFF